MDSSSRFRISLLHSFFDTKTHYPCIILIDSETGARKFRQNSKKENLLFQQKCSSNKTSKAPVDDEISED